MRHTRGAAAPTSGLQDHVAVDEDALDRAVTDVAARAEEWAATTPRQRAELLERIVADTLDVAEEWNQAACVAKGYDSFGCMGPVIATHLDLAGARVVTRVVDAERQNYPLSDMIMTPVEMVSRLSHDMTLLPGDVIACGTSLGVGSIRDGASVDISIEGIGTLVNVLAP